MHGMTLKSVQARHGKFYYYNEDELVGLALATYGEYSEAEVPVFEKVLREGDVAIDVGANIGAFTVPMARFVGPTGKVIAFEASTANAELLWMNAEANGLSEVIEIVPKAASDKIGTISITQQDALHAYTMRDLNAERFNIDCITIDSLNLQKCKLIKIDVDRHEYQVLEGARETIKRCRPIIYIENEHDDLKERLIATLIDMGYRLYWHKPFQFNPDNFFGEKRNIFANIVSVMNVCVPDEEGYEVRNLEEVMDIRNDDQMFDREIARFNRYVERNPDDLDSRLVVAHYSNLMQRTDEAYALLDENLRRDFAHGPSLAVRGLLDLQAQKYNRDTWAAYELRFQQKNLRQFGGDRIHKFGVPQWDGTPTDAPILIWSEQGFGDNIMFSRFMPEVLKRTPNAFLETRPELYELFVFSQSCAYGRRKFPIYRLGRSLPDFEYHCSVPSLAWALGADDAMITKYSAPYLFADPELVRNWKGLGTWSISVSPYPLNGARIGLCQSGSATSERPYTRDVPEELFSKMGRQFGPLFPLQQRGQFESFAMTAACIDALDLIITVDTSIAHLAGAMGKKTWLLLSTDSDFRWGLGEDQIWYPSMRVFKQQKFRDWQGVIDRVMTALEQEGF